jgi:hypothetical protein
MKTLFTTLCTFKAVAKSRTCHSYNIATISRESIRLAALNNGVFILGAAARQHLQLWPDFVERSLVEAPI